MTFKSNSKLKLRSFWKGVRDISPKVNVRWLDKIENFLLGVKVENCWYRNFADETYEGTNVIFILWANFMYFMQQMHDNQWKQKAWGR